MEPRIAIDAHADGGVVVDLPESLRALITSSAQMVVDVVTIPAQVHTPGWNRLFPNAVIDDPAAARRVDDRIGPSIRDRKAAAAMTTRATAAAERLSRADAVAWMRTLNDARLLFGTRIGIRADVPMEGYLEQPETADIARAYLTASGLVDLLVRAIEPAD